MAQYNSLSSADKKALRLEFFEAVENGNIQKVGELIGRHVPMFEIRRNGETALHLAAANGHTELVQYFLERAFNVDERATDTNETPLMQAVRNDHWDTVNLLLDRGASLTAENVYGQSALSYAVMDDRVELIELLVSQGADVNKDKELIFIAIARGYTDSVEALVEAGYNLTERNALGNTPLMEICRVGDGEWEETTEYLIEKGADVNATTPNGTTGLMHAVVNKNYIAASILLDSGANVNAVNLSGTTALMLAAKRDLVQYVRLLLEEGADPDLRNNQGQRAADFTTDEEILELLDMGSMEDSDGEAPPPVLPLPPIAPVEAVVPEGEVPKADTVFEVAMVSDTPMAQFLEEGGDDAVVFHYEQQVIGMPRSVMVSAYNDKSAIHYECTAEKGLSVRPDDVVDAPYYSLSTTFQAFVPVPDMLKILGSKHKHWKLTKGRTLPFTASRQAISSNTIRTIDGEELNLISRDHCQAGTDKTVFSATPVTMAA